MNDETFGGVDPHTLHRTDAPATSVEAAYAVNTTKWERRVYNAIAYYGERGAILDDVWRQVVRQYYAERPAWDPIFCSLANTISGRFASLEKKGLIKYTGETRPGASGKQSRVRVITDKKVAE